MMILMLTKATDEDLDALLHLEEVGFETGRWSRDAWATELGGPDHFVNLVWARGEVIGCASFSVVDDTAELLRVIVTPDARGKGVGEELLEDGFRWATGRGAGRVLLEVEEGNTAALRLYARCGFTQLSRRDNYYGADRHALVMERAL